MNVLALPVGGADVPSTRYRLLKLLPRLDQAEATVRVREPGVGTLHRLLASCRAASALPWADVVLVQKRLIPRVLVRAIGLAQIPIVFDLDDALFVDQTDPDLPSPVTGRLEDLVRRSRLVVAGNEYLAEWARGLGAQVCVISTGVDADTWNPAALRRHEGVVLGWVGTSSNLRYLEAIATPLLDALDAVPGSRLVVVSDRPPSFEHRAVEFRRWTLATELDSVSDFDIGLMPLNDDPWTRGKCAFKALQCMSLGLPVIASSVGASADVISHGLTGLLARNDVEWAQALSALMCDGPMRHTLGGAAREAILERHSLDRAGADLAAVLQRALLNPAVK